MRLGNRATGAVDAGAGRRARTQILAVADAVAIGIDAAIATARDGIADRQFAVLCRRHARCVVVEQEEQRQLQAGSETVVEDEVVGRARSEKRRVGAEGGSTCKSRWTPRH